jgi:dissimilatory sulfite reductase (desulfoviridin) alpha/beta subunit
LLLLLLLPVLVKASVAGCVRSCTTPVVTA